jgi:hypothetical protein
MLNLRKILGAFRRMARKIHIGWVRAAEIDRKVQEEKAKHLTRLGGGFPHF